MEKSSTNIPENPSGSQPHPGRKLPQYIAALAANLGTIAAGLMLGWSSPADKVLLEGTYYDFEITEIDNAWVGSISLLGAAVPCYLIGIFMDKFGRKPGMLILVIPFVVGWLLIYFAQNLGMLLAGRFLTGVSSGALCVTTPTYISEIAQDNIRGEIGSYFEMMFNVGLLIAYIMGSYLDFWIFNLVCTIFPFIFGAVFLFMPETPYYLIFREKPEEAKKALTWLRGIEYDQTIELNNIKIEVEEEKNNTLSIFQLFAKRTTVMSLFICMALMFFQQFSGVNAVVLNAASIFLSADISISPDVAAIIIGFVQVPSNYLATVLIDRLGRKILLLVSAISMTICNVLLGVFFYLKTLPEPDEELIESMSWVPLVALCIFIIGFSIGYGPIPWLIASELCTKDTKAFVTATGATFNWALAFIITRTFIDMQNGLGEGGAFWLFSVFTGLGILFVIFVVPETKGKTIEEAQQMLSKKSKKKNIDNA